MPKGVEHARSCASFVGTDANIASAGALESRPHCGVWAGQERLSEIVNVGIRQTLFLNRSIDGVFFLRRRVFSRLLLDQCVGVTVVDPKRLPRSPNADLRVLE
jgi:hypothetical protein